MTACSDCGSLFEDDTPRMPCPKCGGTRRTIDERVGLGAAAGVAASSNITIVPKAVLAATEILIPTLWISANFAPIWFAEAVDEARRGVGRHPRRREIVFAVCFVESYLFEFVRDVALRGRFEDLPTYFRQERVGICDRWKRVLKQLKENGKITAIPDFSADTFREFTKLVGYRDGLVHGGASWPWTSSQGRNEGPVPPLDDLDKLPAGWAVGIVVDLVKDLHKSTAVELPGWLVWP